MSTQPWVESPLRDRVARVVVLSLVIGYSATAAVHLTTAKNSRATVATAAAPVVVSASHAPSVAPLVAARAAAAVPPAKAVAHAERIKAWAVSPNGHLIVPAKEILLTDRRVRVGEAPFRPVKQALIEFQKSMRTPTVTLTAAADIPEKHVKVVKSFMERFYGWKVTTVVADTAGVFELDVAPASQGVQP